MNTPTTPAPSRGSAHGVRTKMATSNRWVDRRNWGIFLRRLEGAPRGWTNFRPRMVANTLRFRVCAAPPGAIRSIRIAAPKSARRRAWTPRQDEGRLSGCGTTPATGLLKTGQLLEHLATAEPDKSQTGRSTDDYINKFNEFGFTGAAVAGRLAAKRGGKFYRQRSGKFFRRWVLAGSHGAKFRQ